MGGFYSQNEEQVLQLANIFRQQTFGACHNTKAYTIFLRHGFKTSAWIAEVHMHWFIRNPFVYLFLLTIFASFARSFRFFSRLLLLRSSFFALSLLCRLTIPPYYSIILLYSFAHFGVDNPENKTPIPLQWETGVLIKNRWPVTYLIWQRVCRLFSTMLVDTYSGIKSRSIVGWSATITASNIVRDRECWFTQLQEVMTRGHLYICCQVCSVRQQLIPVEPLFPE